MQLSLQVQYANANKFTATVSSSATIAEFKEQIAPRVDVPAAFQRLIHRGRVLKDEQTLESYGAHGRFSRPPARARAASVRRAIVAAARRASESAFCATRRSLMCGAVRPLRDRY